VCVHVCVCVCPCERARVSECVRVRMFMCVCMCVAYTPVRISVQGCGCASGCVGACRSLVSTDASMLVAGEERAEASSCIMSWHRKGAGWLSGSQVTTCAYMHT